MVTHHLPLAYLIISQQTIHFLDIGTIWLLNLSKWLFLLKWFIYGNDYLTCYNNKDNIPLSANPTKWSNTLTQFVGKLPTNCLSVFDHFVGLALKGICIWKKILVICKLYTNPERSYFCWLLINTSTKFYNCLEYVWFMFMETLSKYSAFNNGSFHG